MIKRLKEIREEKENFLKEEILLLIDEVVRQSDRLDTIEKDIKRESTEFGRLKKKEPKAVEPKKKKGFFK